MHALVIFEIYTTLYCFGVSTVSTTTETEVALTLAEKTANKINESFFNNTNLNMLRRVKRQFDTTTDTTTTTVNPVTTPLTNPPETLPPETLPPATAPPPNIGSPGFTCSSDLYQRYDTRCCRVPSLVIEPSWIKQCEVKPKPIAVTLLRGTHYWIKFNGVAKPTNEPKTMITTAQICLVHCIFKTARWLTPQNQVDPLFMYRTVETSLTGQQPDYTATAYNAIVECTNIIADPLATVTTAFGQKCLLAPVKLLRCVKRYMMLNCLQLSFPQSAPLTRNCSLDRLQLDRCDPQLV